MVDVSGNSERIAKNTMFLYVRMLLLMVVTIYSSRVVLAALGAIDYGVFDVVCGTAAILGVLNSTMSGANARFFSVSLESGSKEKLSNVMSCVKFIHIILSVIIVIFAETLGLWLVNNKLVIPPDRISSALLCYHFCVFSVVVTVLSIPYNSLIIAREKMKAFAYISLLDAFLRLLIAFALSFIHIDKLFAYGLMWMIVQVSVRIIYVIYCNKNFSESKEKPKYTKGLIKKIAFFSAYTFIGNVASMFNNQGMTILLNIFFGPVVNAARSLALQLQGGCTSLVSNFQVAIQPQIYKSWTQNNKSYMYKLVVYGTKFSYFLTAILVVPLFYFLDPLLQIWLTDVPEHTSAFVKIVLVCAMLESFSHELIAAVHATGVVGKFHILEGAFLLLVVPVSYFALKYFNVDADHIMWTYFVIQLITQILRIRISLPLINLSLKRYLTKAVLPLILPTFFYLLPYLFICFPKDIPWHQTVIYTFIAVIYVILVSFFLGFNKKEKYFVVNHLKKTFVCH